MVSCRLVQAVPDGAPKSLSDHDFLILPRVGDFIALNVKDVARTFRVAAIYHSPAPAKFVDGVVVEAVGSELNYPPKFAAL